MIYFLSFLEILSSWPTLFSAIYFTRSSTILFFKALFAAGNEAQNYSKSQSMPP